MALGDDVDVGHAPDVQAKPPGGLFAVAKGGDGGHLQVGLQPQGILHMVAVGEGDPAAVQLKVGELQDQILHDEAGVQPGLGMIFGQQHQILGRAHQELMITGGTLQGLPGVGAEEVQLGADLGDQALDAVAVVCLQLLQGLEGDLLFPEGPDRLSVLDQCGVIHKVTS